MFRDLDGPGWVGCGLPFSVAGRAGFPGCRGNLAHDLHALGEHQAARDLNEDTLARRRRVLGEDHPDTLTSAGNLTLDLHALGEHQAARDLYEDTLTRYQRVLGDHPDTLTSADGLVDLSDRPAPGA
jgi:hypothetical protein